MYSNLKLLLYEFKLDHNAEKVAKNMCCEKSEVSYNHRYHQNVEEMSV